MTEEKYVLAMYDIRGKQEFVFRTNKLQEIVGASWIIRDCFNDFLFAAAQEVADNEPVKKATDEKVQGIYSYKTENQDTSNKNFSWKNQLGSGAYIGEVVYDGGGNFILLFKSKALFQKVTYRFTKKLLQYIGTLRVLATCVEVDDEKSYQELSALLYQKHRINEARESNISAWACPPIVQVDRKTSMPLIDNDASATDDSSLAAVFSRGKGLEKEEIEKVCGKVRSLGKLSKEAFAKRLKYHMEVARMRKEKNSTEKSSTEKAGSLTNLERDFYCNNEDILDNLVEEKGVDSQLAVIYIDGNSMGAKVERILEEAKKSNDTDSAKKDAGGGISSEFQRSCECCIPKLRTFSAEIQNLYVEDGINAALKDVEENAFRIVVSAGDEVNFIVKAKDAFRCAKNYLDVLKENKDDEHEASACAGIAVFHSHAPYAEAYRIAEECCETGKKIMKEQDLTCASFIDYHICQGAIGTSLEDIRNEENDGVISRPWLLWKKKGKGEKPEKEMETCVCLEDLGKMQKDVNEREEKEQITYYCAVQRIVDILKHFGRSNIKGLAQAAKDSSYALEMELKRIWAHAGKEKQEAVGKENWENLLNLNANIKGEKGNLLRNMIYDIVIAYDLWFAEDTEETGKKETLEEEHYE